MPTPTVRTTDATTSPLGNYPIPPETTATIRFVIQASNHSGDVTTWLLEYLFYRIAGGDVVLGGTGIKRKITSSGLAGKWNVDISPSGPNIAIDCTGDIGQIVDWLLAGDIFTMEGTL